MPGMNGIEVLREIRRRDQNLSVVIITAYGTIERAVEAVKAGANDFVTKPFDPEHLALVVKKALERAELRSEVEFLAQESAGDIDSWPGKNDFMVQTVEEAKKAAGSRSTVLLLGESGTGKEIFARAIHDWSAGGRPHSSLLTVSDSPKSFWRASYLGMRRAPSPEPISSKRGKSNRPTAALYSWTRSAISPRSYRPSFYDSLGT